MKFQIQTLEHSNYSAARVPVAAVGADHRVCVCPANCGACPVLVDPKGNSSCLYLDHQMCGLSSRKRDAVRRGRVQVSAL